MSDNSNKIRTGFYLEKELLDECDCFLERSNSRSRNELVRKAIEFYLGHLKAQDNVEYLAPAIKKLVTSAVSASEEKTSRLLFKIAVELGKFQICWQQLTRSMMKRSASCTSARILDGYQRGISDRKRV